MMAAHPKCVVINKSIGIIISRTQKPTNAEGRNNGRYRVW